MKHMWYIHTIEYYSSIKINKSVIHLTTQINFKNLVLSKRSQAYY